MKLEVVELISNDPIREANRLTVSANNPSISSNYINEDMLVITLNISTIFISITTDETYICKSKSRYICSIIIMSYLLKYKHDTLIN
jgi:hypothetical protein